ncbi:MAG TPA: hypothetical protein VMF51_24870 [Nocardioides sp.]|uniref:hypothetical protein n=1 Tax=Nocardioides sp. TaxID=35761 RepID=UPI002CA23EB8|nr:hypothetical protein [Nocardioides sp.]HTW18381.1 hypothetical protein [Nocardioides sp.]
MKVEVARAANRAKRELIHRVPAVRRRVDEHRASLADDHRSRLPDLAPAHRQLVDDLRGNGMSVTRWDAMGLPGVDPLKPLLLQLSGLLADRSPGGSHSVLLGRDEMLEDVALWRWGLQSQVLDLVENYLGVPVRYYGPLVHRECSDGRTVDTRQWHRDIEDHRMLKILVWLNDVDSDGGPFTYVPRPRSTSAARALRYVGGFVDDERFAAAVPRETWRQATGPRWTAGVPDTAQIFHRAAPPTARDRYSVTFTWMTRRPFTTIAAAPWRPDQVRRCVAGLDPRQRACLPPAMVRMR